MVRQYWQPKPGGTWESHWIDLVSIEAPEGQEGFFQWEASARFDGCVHLNRHYIKSASNEDNHEPEMRNVTVDSDYLHICGVSDLIDRLKELHDIAREHFGKQNAEFWD